ncbi:hypothetical protein [Spartinivicinus poritis]|uniref:Uncharacterized protein n=1 Tax=Spartinivicinus poritis TaxID=2994640 RepID=A0ABT5U327_9GAMM|nr:hypothetical protein [Spartinivicinus sp. A2-2]MDE1460766.1 hypothetical protein [Spartinivicinus sp. A2-2]
MKRYKQSILSDYFIVQDLTNNVKHLMEANYDIEASMDRTLCTEVLQHSHYVDVLTGAQIGKVCPICKAILDRRISNMPRSKSASSRKADLEEALEPQQLAFDF